MQHLFTEETEHEFNEQHQMSDAEYQQMVEWNVDMH